MFEQLPYLGIGLGWRNDIESDIRANRNTIDWLEVITDHHTYPGGLREVRALREEFPIIPHGLELSIAGEDELDEDYVARVGRVVEAVDPPWFSDHLCYTRAHGLEMGTLVPVPRTPDVVDRVVRRARYVQDRIGRPLLLENITYQFESGTMSESELISAVCERSGCGLLLDLTNVHTNAVNHGFDAYSFLDSVPLDRVVQVHVAGGFEHGGTMIDSHSQPVPPQVWDLLRYVAPRAPLKGVLMERDDDFPEDFQEIVADLQTARTIMDESRRAAAFERGTV